MLVQILNVLRSERRATLAGVSEGLPEIILASGSPRRRELLAGLGLTFRIKPADVDETPQSGEAPDALVARLSGAKAETVAKTQPDALVIAADTVVVVDGDILGKPKDERENRRFLERLSGRAHSVYTGHSLMYGPELGTKVVASKVRFRALSALELDWYVATGEGLDKAGGYGIQGKGAAFIPYIEGCYFNVMGLSVSAVVTTAADLGLKLLEPSGMGVGRV